VKRFRSRIFDRLRSRQALMLFAAVGLGVAAAAVSHTAQTQERSLLKDQLIQSERLVEVVVAGRALARNRLLQEDDLAVRLLPQNWLHADQISPEAVDRVVGTRLTRDIAAGTPVSLTDTTPADLSAKATGVRAGYRLMSLPVDEASSVSGLIRPGHWIDLWAASPISVPSDTAVVSTDIQVLQASVTPPSLADLVASAVRVVAVGGDTRMAGVYEEDAGAARYSSLTIEIPADRVAALLTAQARGRLIALLRADVQPQPRASRASRASSAARVEGSSPQKPRVEVIVHSQGGQS